MEIGKKDIFWNYASTFLKIAGGAVLLPFILHMMPAEKVGIWTIFITITSFVGLLDFGFNPSFTRNVTYVFSGVSSLMKNGYDDVEHNSKVDYGLLKGLIDTMRWFYSRMAILVFILLASLGTFYIHRILNSYNGPKLEVYIAWGFLCLISTYNLYTLYYDSLLQGKGLIKRSKQIVIIGQGVYLTIAAILIMFGFGLIAIVLAQLSSVIIVRTLSYMSFFDSDIKQSIKQSIPKSKDDIFRAVYPNAIKIGLTSLGGFLVTRSAMVIGSFYLSLEQIGSYGITMQLVGVISAMAAIYLSTFNPKIVQLRVENEKVEIKRLYIIGKVLLFFTYLIGSFFLLYVAPWGLSLVGSKTTLLPFSITVFVMIVTFLETNHSTAGSILLTKNTVPFFKASLLSGLITIVLLLLLFKFTTLGIWAMIIAPGIAQGIYQNWKWPMEVHKELKITYRDFKLIFENN